MNSSIYKTYTHNPPHLYLPGIKYWVTGSAYKKKSYFFNDRIKEKMIKILQKGCQKYDWQIDDWVILDDHYHLMLQASNDRSKTIKDIMQNFHKFSSMWIRNNNIEYKYVDHIFYNYWDTCITFERSYYARINYIYYNPVRHGYVNNPEDYPYGSYSLRYKKEKKYLIKLKMNYPFDSLNLE